LHGPEDVQSRTDCALGVVLVRARPAKVDQQSVAHELCDEAIEARNNPDTGVLIRSDEIAIVLGIEFGRKGGRPHQVAEHDADLAALGVGGLTGTTRTRLGGRMRFRFGPERASKPRAVAKGNAKLLQFVVGEVRQGIEVNVIVRKQPRVSLQAYPFQPFRNLLHWRPVPIIGNQQSVELTSSNHAVVDAFLGRNVRKGSIASDAVKDGCRSTSAVPRNRT
jgi:hypothetical protein